MFQHTTDARFRPTRYAKFIALFGLFVLFSQIPGKAFAQPSPGDDPTTNTFRANILPSLTIPRVFSAVNIDGNLDEDMWQTAAVATNFSESFPEERALPPIGVRTLIAYDENNLYVAYIIEDDPEDIRYHLSDRDQIWHDDYAGMLLDTNGDGQVIYFIAANPLVFRATHALEVEMKTSLSI